MTLALSEPQEFWFLSIGLGFAVLAIVTILLTMLVSLLGDVTRRFDRLQERAGRARSGLRPDQLDGLTERSRELREQVSRRYGTDGAHQ